MASFRLRTTALLTWLHRSLYPLLTQTGEVPHSSTPMSLWGGVASSFQQPTDLTILCRFVLLVSGLGLGGGGGESLLGTQLLVDVVTGQLGDEGEQCSAAHVSRVILAGNLLSHNTQSRDSINKVRSSPDCSAWPVSMTGPCCSRVAS